MTEIPKSHPRYESLMTREKITEGVEKGLTSRQGLIAQGRGEAFDYLIGERTLESAHYAQAVAAALLLLAKKPVISVNGNAAALVPSELVTLSQLTGAQLEVNLFHRTEERVQKIAEELKKHGADVVLGENAEPLLPLDHDRSKVERDGIYAADVIFVPLEDGDRCEVLANMKKLVIAVDLNPLSRTSQTAHISIVDNLTRAVKNMIELIPDLKNMSEDELWGIIGAYDNPMTLIDAIEEIKEHLEQIQDELFGPEEEPEPDPEVVAAMQKRSEIARRVMMRGGDLMME